MKKKKTKNVEKLKKKTKKGGTAKKTPQKGATIHEHKETDSHSGAKIWYLKKIGDTG